MSVSVAAKKQTAMFTFQITTKGRNKEEGRLRGLDLSQHKGGFVEENGELR